MSAHRKYYAVFLSPGTLFPEETVKPVDSWNNRAQACLLAQGISERYNATPYGFYFETRLVCDPVDDGEGGQLNVEPKVQNRSGLHFLGGRLETYDEVVERDDPKEQILCCNMASLDRCIVCINENSYRTTIQFAEDAVLLDRETGEILDRGDDEVHMAYRAKRKVIQDAEFAQWEAKAKAEREKEPNDS